MLSHRNKLIALLVPMTLLPLLIAVPRSLQVFERWASEEGRLQLTEQQKLFERALRLREEQVLASLSAFAARPTTVRALGSSHWDHLLTLSITTADALAADRFFLVSAQGEPIFDAVSLRWGEEDPDLDLYVGLGLSHQDSVGLEYVADSGFGIAASVPVVDQASQLLGVVVAFAPLGKEWLDLLKSISGFDFTLATGDQRSALSTWLSGDQLVPAVQEQADQTLPAEIAVQGGGYIALRDPLVNLAGSCVGHLLISRSDQRLRAAVGTASREVSLTAFGALILALILGSYVSHRLAEPLGEPGRTAHLEQLVEERTAELRASQAELLHNERLATLGQLTATVSHELRNPLGAMRPSLYTIRKRAGTGDPKLLMALDRVERGIRRCDHIIDELLDFTRKGRAERMPVVIDSWLGELLDKEGVPEGLTVRRELALPGLTVEVDSESFRRAVVKVYENACQAMASKNEPARAKEGSILTVSTRRAGECLEIEVADTGPGIPEHDLPRIFEPLYSTRMFGLGLGLPTVQRILEDHGGEVEIETTVGQGTSVVFRLPLDEGEQGDSS